MNTGNPIVDDILETEDLNEKRLELLTIFYQDLLIKKCTEKDILIDDETMALVAVVRKTLRLNQNLHPK